MWVSFFLSIAVGILVLYGPGYVFWRGMRLPRLLSACCAPIYGVFLYATLPIAYDVLGVRSSPTTLLLPAMGIALAVYLLFRPRQPGESPISFCEEQPIRIGRLALPYDLAVPLAYVLLASVVCAFIYVHNLSTADAFANRYDNQTHLNLTRAFLDSGRWSSLHNSKWLASPEAARATLGDGGFYPAAWQCLVALICSATGVSVPVGANALTVVVSSVLFPLSEYAFLRALLHDNRRAIVLGALAASGFANWPWHYTLLGPLLPNMLGASLQFAVMGIIVLQTRNGALPRGPIFVGAFGVMSFVALSLAHPNTLFSIYVFIAFYVAVIIAERTKRPVRRALALASFGTIIVGIWVGFYHLPFFSGVIAYPPALEIDLFEAIGSVATLSLWFCDHQAGMVVACACGLVVLARRDDRWAILCPAAFFALSFIAVQAGRERIGYWTGALWYSDHRRISTNLVLYLMPIAALGLDWISSKLTRRFSPLAGLAALGLIAAITYLPNPLTRTPYVRTSGELAKRYGATEQVLDYDERVFVRKVRESVPTDALIINAPADGSTWTYGAESLNTYYRTISLAGMSENACIIREQLDQYATSKEVQEAVKATGACYVLLLDKGVAYDDGIWPFQYVKASERTADDMESSPEDWEGITSIGDDTPGFELVLAEGDEMRLYRIKPTEEGA